LDFLFFIIIIDEVLVEKETMETVVMSEYYPTPKHKSYPYL